MLGCVVYSVKSVELSPLVATPVFHEIFSQRKAWFESHLWIILKTIAQSYREEEEDCKQALRNLGGSLKRRKKNHGFHLKRNRFIVCRVKLAFQNALIFKSIERTASDFLYSSMGNSRSETHQSQEPWWAPVRVPCVAVSERACSVCPLIESIGPFKERW